MGFYEVSNSPEWLTRPADLVRLPGKLLRERRLHLILNVLGDAEDKAVDASKNQDRSRDSAKDQS
jgi:hypothetical protein